MKKKLLFLLLLVGAITLVFSGTVEAQGLRDAFSNSGPLGDVGTRAGVSTNDTVGSITGRIINAVLSLVGLIFLVLTVYSGILWMTARGNDEQVSKAQKILTGSIIGLVITLSSYAITIFVTGRFTP